MPKPNNSYEELARQASKRMDEVRAQDRQLSLLPDEPGEAVQDVAEGKIGRPPGAQNKGSSQLREWLAAQGCRMPEDQLAEMAGLKSPDGPVTAAIAQAEKVLAWAFQDAKVVSGARKGEAITPQPTTKLALMMQFLAIQERAAAAILPYGTPKASPDTNVIQNTTVIVPAAPAAPADPAAVARDVTPSRTGRMMPADVREEMEQNQRLSDEQSENSDDQSRTGGASD
ncbi:MAG: hypothetical protein AAF582_00100 [Pseudomonadota bacterium]